MLAGTLAGLTVNPARCAAAVADPALLATDLADYLVERGVPFREAHHITGTLVARAEAKGCDLPDLTLLAFQARREDDTMAATRPHVLHHHLRLVGRAMVLQPRSHRQRIASLGVVDRFLRCSWKQ